MAPLLLLLLFGIVDFGRAIFYANALTNSAREGTRVAVLASNPCNTELGSNGAACGGQPTLIGPTVCQAIQNESQLVGNWSCSDSGTLPAAGAADTGYVQVVGGTDCATAASVATPRASGNRAVKVTIHYYYRPLTPIVSSFFPTGFHLTTTACGRAEY
ncbi:MAG: hypothetical protein QOE92_1395 [Chloroflexota bacterium]|nr:hypothetical protein [Chloroflexota bacterium]